MTKKPQEYWAIRRISPTAAGWVCLRPRARVHRHSVPPVPSGPAGLPWCLWWTWGATKAQRHKFDTRAAAEACRHRLQRATRDGLFRAPGERFTIVHVRRSAKDTWKIGDLCTYDDEGGMVFVVELVDVKTKPARVFLSALADPNRLGGWNSTHRCRRLPGRIDPRDPRFARSVNDRACPKMSAGDLERLLTHPEPETATFTSTYWTIRRQGTADPGAWAHFAPGVGWWWGGPEGRRKFGDVEAARSCLRSLRREHKDGIFKTARGVVVRVKSARRCTRPGNG